MAHGEEARIHGRLSANHRLKLICMWILGMDGRERVSPMVECP